MGRRLYWGALGLAALAAGGVGHRYLAEAEAPAGRMALAEEPAPEKAVAVEAEPVVIDAVLQDIRAVGTLMPNEAVTISPEIAGRIESIGFGEGDEVAAGDVLFELDAVILRAEMTKALSDLTLSDANRDRAMTLARSGTGTLRARDEALAAHRLAEADVALAQARLEKASIAAPFSGIVGLRSVSVGAYVIPGDRLVDLADVDPIKVDFRVPELALRSLRAGQAVQVGVDAVPGRTFEGEVYAIDPVVDANGRAVRLRARVANPDRVLSPGLFARIQILVERRDNAVLVPESAVVAEGEDRFVYRVVEGRAARTRVELGLRRPGQVEIVEGLEAGSVVVTAGHQKIREGSLLEVLDMRPGS